MRTVLNDEFIKWIDFSDEEMTHWAGQYFKKLGYPPKHFLTRNAEKSLLQQVEAYCSDVQNILDKENTLIKMKRAWGQYKRRKKAKHKQLTVNIKKDTFAMLTKIKERNQFTNIGQSIDSLFDGSLVSREMAQLEKANIALKSQLEKVQNQAHLKADLVKMEKKIEFLEKQNAVLTQAIEKLTTSQ
ncbi:MAG: hypothetical protein ACTH7Q_02710 [Pseudoalteromonas sp.]|uniref:hypothetical protein n=1 Tax=Pseudoalteromonas nigrifaciens TaxID=28109 RepID=UPI003F9B1C19